MLTLLLCLIIFCLIAIGLLVVTGIGIVFWPLLLILGIGLFIDIIAFKILFKKKKK